MLQPSTYLETVLVAGAGLYKHGRRLSGICSSVGLGAGLVFVSRDSLSDSQVWRETSSILSHFFL